MSLQLSLTNESYNESYKFRDLAARNVLLDENCMAKVGNKCYTYSASKPSTFKPCPRIFLRSSKFFKCVLRVPIGSRFWPCSGRKRQCKR